MMTVEGHCSYLDGTEIIAEKARSGHVVPRDELQKKRVSNPPKTDQIKAIEVK